MRCYGLRAAALATVLSGVVIAICFALGGVAGIVAGCAIIAGCGWIVYFYSEQAVLSALRARPVGEVEMPQLYGLVRELCVAARLRVPRLFLSPAVQPNVLCVGCTPRSVALCVTEGLLRGLSPSELRAVLAQQLGHVSRRDIVVSSWAAGFAALFSLAWLRPLAALVLRWSVPSAREYGADASGALLTGDPMALASALRKIDWSAARLPLPPRGALAASSHLMIAHPLPDDGYGRLFLTHPPVGERVRRLEMLAGYPR